MTLERNNQLILGGQFGVAVLIPGFARAIESLQRKRPRLTDSSVVESRHQSAWAG